MIGCSVEKNSSSGVRSDRHQVAPRDRGDVGERPAQLDAARTAAPVVAATSTAVIAPSSLRRPRRSASSLDLGALAREAQEHVVEARLAQHDPADDDAGRVEAAGAPRRSSPGRGRPSARSPRPRRRVPWSARASRSSVALATSATFARVSAITVSPSRALRSDGVPSAMIRPWSTTTSALRRAVGLLEVLGREQDRGPRRRRAARSRRTGPGGSAGRARTSARRRRAAGGSATSDAARSSRRRMPPE